jgi:hypothetical protein
MGGEGARDLEALAVANAEAAGGLLREVEQVRGDQDALPDGEPIHLKSGGRLQTRMPSACNRSIRGCLLRIQVLL